MRGGTRRRRGRPSHRDGVRGARRRAPAARSRSRTPDAIAHLVPGLRRDARGARRPDRWTRREEPRVSLRRHDRRAGGRGQEHDRARRRRAARFPLPRHRRALPRAGAQGARAGIAADDADARRALRARDASSTSRARPTSPTCGSTGSTSAAEIRTPAVSEMSSRLAAQPAVRRRLIEIQRRLCGARARWWPRDATSGPWCSRTPR